MERRDFLSRVAFGATAVGSGAVWLPGCVGSSVQATPMTAADASDLLDRLERGVAGVRAPLELTLGQPWSVRPESDRMLRLGLEALVVADVARSITPGTIVPDALAARLGEALPVLDECVVAYHALLERTPPAVRRNLDAHFRREPDTAMRVAEAVDGRASELGISNESRLRWRRIATDVGARITRQSANAVIDDSVEKIATASAHAGGDVRRARTADTHAIIDAVWQQVDGPPQASIYAAPPASAAPAPTTTGAPAAQATAFAYAPSTPAETPELQVPEHVQGAGDTETTVGGVMLGVGLAVFGVVGIATLATGNPWPLIIGSTPAGVAVIIGIILLIIGAVQNARG